MSNSVNLKMRLKNKHDIPANWANATFAPMAGEIIVYDDHYFDDDGNKVVVADAVKFKIGDGVTPINDLPFVSDTAELEKLIEETYETKADADNQIAKLEDKLDGRIVYAVFNITQANTTISLQSLDMNSIDWGDGTVNNEPHHTYANIGEYTCKIYGVTTIGNRAFSWCNSLAEVVIGDSVTTIGYMAFYDCDRLTEVVIPDSVTTISDSAFNNCSSLTSVEIPNSVTTIGSAAFYHCDSLTSVTFKNKTPVTFSNNLFTACPVLTHIYVPYGCVEAYHTKWSADGASEDILNKIVESDREAMMSDLDGYATKEWIQENTFSDLNLENGTAAGSLQQVAIEQENYTTPGGIASGVGAVALTGQRGDKDPATLDPNEDRISEARGLQSFVQGPGNLSAGDWTATFGKDNSTYQKNAFTVGGTNITGWSEEAWNKIYTREIEGYRCPIYIIVNDRHLRLDSTYREAIYIDNVTGSTGHAVYAPSYAASLPILNDQYQSWEDVKNTADYKASKYVWLATFGNNNINVGESNLVGGGSNTVKGSRNIVGGYNNKVNSSYSNVSGLGNIVNTISAETAGQNNTVSGSCHITGGQENIVSGEGNLTTGKDNSNLGYQGTIHGVGLEIKEGHTAQTALGWYNENKEDTLLEIGYGQDKHNRKNVFEVYKDGTVKSKQGTLSTREYVNKTVAAPKTKLNIGSRNDDTESKDSLTVGTHSLNRGYQSAAIGYDAYIGYDSSGNATSKQPTGAVALNWSRANADYCLSAGYDTEVNHSYSVALNNKTKTGASAQTVLGSYNAAKSTTAFEVGNGSASKRKNAFEVLKDGRAKVQTAPIDNDDVVRLAEMEKIAEVSVKNAVKITKYIHQGGSYSQMLEVAPSEELPGNISLYQNSVEIAVDGPTTKNSFEFKLSPIQKALLEDNLTLQSIKFKDTLTAAQFNSPAIKNNECISLSFSFEDRPYPDYLPITVIVSNDGSLASQGSAGYSLDTENLELTISFYNYISVANSHSDEQYILNGDLTVPLVLDNKEFTLSYSNGNISLSKYITEEYKTIAKSLYQSDCRNLRITSPTGASAYLQINGDSGVGSNIAGILFEPITYDITSNARATLRYEGLPLSLLD